MVGLLGILLGEWENIWKVRYLHECQVGPLGLNTGIGQHPSPACTGIVSAKYGGIAVGLQESTNLVEFPGQVKTHRQMHGTAAAVLQGMVDRIAVHERLEGFADPFSCP